MSEFPTIERGTRLGALIRRLLDVPSTDPDEARRRGLLSILLAGLMVCSIAEILFTIYADIAGLFSSREIAVLYALGVGSCLGTVGLYWLNRARTGPWARVLFLLLLLLIAALGDEPQHVAGGRSLAAFTIPILAASVLLPPFASFVVAALSSAITLIIALQIDIAPEAPMMIVFVGVATVSWLSARTTERALRDLRTLNLELDQRVRDRTREVAEALGKNKAMVESIADGVIVFDMEGKAIFANPAISALIGRPVERIIGSGVKDLLGDEVAPEDRETVAELLREREAPEPSLKFEWGERTFSMSVAPVRVGAMETIGTVAVFRDFTREAELDRMKSSFVSIASHELRTPLNAILGYTDMLQAGVYGKLPDKQGGILERVVTNIGLLLNLVNNLLDRAQIEAGTIRLHVAPFEPADLVSQVVGVTGTLASAKGLRLTSDIASEVPDQIQGDQQRLHQVLENLVSNALKFTDEGDVAIRAYLPDADHWALEVNDTGCGIPPEAHSYIFEPFRQVDDSITRQFAGPGLGLAIVKQLTELMGGRIELESEVGRGSTFTVILPLVPPAAGEEDSTPDGTEVATEEAKGE